MSYSKFDAVNYLQTEADIAAYLTAALNENDPELLLAALGDIARAKGIANLAGITGLNRESMYKALRPGAKPRFDTILRIIHGLNIRLEAIADIQAS